MGAAHGRAVKWRCSWRELPLRQARSRPGTCPVRSLAVPGAVQACGAARVSCVWTDGEPDLFEQALVAVQRPLALDAARPTSGARCAGPPTAARPGRGELGARRAR